jgi:FkbM family methyltransferase
MSRAFAFLSAITRSTRYRIAASLCPRFLSYSPYGEDKVVIGHLFTRIGGDLPSVRYLDIGAGDPVLGSNTFALYQLGASGVLVEPEPGKAAALRRRRPRDTVVQAAAAFDDRRHAKLVRFGPGQAGLFDTFSEKQAERVLEASKSWREPLRAVDKIDVDLVPVNDLITAHFGGAAPTFLSIDVEGYNYEVLASMDLSVFRPNLICVEASRPPGEFTTLLVPHGYQLICLTPDNLIFLRPS